MLNFIFSFYEHNASLVGFLVLGLFSIVMLLLEPRRFYVLTLLSSLLLGFSFEYRKHLLPHVRTHILYFFFPSRTGFTKFRFLEFFLMQALPFFLDLAGWFLLLISLYLIDKQRSDQ
ncbi:MAG: hypothetical protein ACOC6Q_01920 [Patescibacteria group bacterium]